MYIYNSQTVEIFFFKRKTSAEICFSIESLLSISTPSNFTQFSELLLAGLYLENMNLSLYYFS